MGRRERLERKLELRLDWGEKADQRAAQRFQTARAATDGIPFGQPILVGHHSEKRHRAAIDKMARNMTKGCEESDLAKHHRSAADGIEAALDRSIFSDDDNAVEAIEGRIAEREAQRAQMVAANKYWRKHKSMKGYPGLTDEQAAKLDADIPTRYSWERQPYAPYQLSNLSGRIRADRERLKVIKVQADRTEKAEAAGGVLLVVDHGGEWCRLTFADRPERAVINDLKAAGYRWGGGSWCGHVAKLPESTRALLPAVAE